MYGWGVAETTEIVVCAGCGVSFSKLIREARRQRKRGQRRFFCTQSCRTSLQNKEVPRGSVQHLRSGNRRDEHTSFRWFLLRARQRTHRHGPSNLTLEHLAQLWVKQAGLCALTGWALDLPDNADGWKRGAHIRNASLDRIDPSLGYVLGNVRFVSVIANLARSVFTDSDLHQFCAAVILHRDRT